MATTITRHKAGEEGPVSRGHRSCSPQEGIAGVEGQLFSKSSEMIKKAGETKKLRQGRKQPETVQREAA